MDIITYALCKKLASGAVSGVTSMSVSGQTLTINCTDGTVLTMDFPTPADGISITGVAVNASKHLIVTLSDSSTIDAGEVPTVQGDTGLGIKGVAINNSNHLIVTYDDDTTEDAGEIEGIHTSFSDITDIAVSELADGQILKYDATSGKWKNVSPGSVDTDLGDLNDVDLTNIQDGQMIAWDATNSKWVNVTPSADIESLNDIDDVDIANPSNGQMLKFNGTSEKWENATIDATPTENSTNAVQSGGVFTALGNKVDKVSGKGLSTEDYTSEEKTKLSGIETGAEVNVQSDWNQSNNEADDFIKNKPTLGTAAALDVATSGDASSTQVVKGDDTRLTDARTPVSHTHTLSEVTDAGTAAGKDYTDLVRPNSHDLVESGSVYSAITEAVSSVYTPRGSKTCAELTSALLIEANIGSCYNVSDSGTTTADFIQGAGQTITAGDTVGIVKAGATAIKFNLMGNTLDLHNYQTKALETAVAGQSTVQTALTALNTNKADKSEMSVTDGTGADADKTTIQLKDGTSATVLKAHQDITGKADKVSGATNGNFAGLDANGNLTDSGKKASDFISKSYTYYGTVDTKEELIALLNARFAELNANERQCFSFNDHGTLISGGTLFCEMTKAQAGYGTAVLYSYYSYTRHNVYYTVCFNGTWQDVMRLPRVNGTTETGNIASFDSKGNLTDSGKASADVPTVWSGHTADWNALSALEKNKYKYVCLDDDGETGDVVDAVTNGNMNPVTSNAVYDKFVNKLHDARILTFLTENTTVTVQLPRAYRGMCFISAYANNHDGIIDVRCDNSGGVAVTKLVGASEITVDTSQANKVSFTSTGYAVYALMQMSGSTDAEIV